MTGFTLVELLIVIVVIAILAAISVVAFNGVQDRAHETVLIDDIKRQVRALELDRVTRGEYAPSLGAISVQSASGSSSDIAYQYTSSGDGTSSDFCLTGSYKKFTKHVSTPNINTFTEGACSDHAAPRTSPISVADKQVGVFQGPRANTFSIPINSTLSNNDLVFVVFNHDSVNTLTNVSLNGTPMDNVYAKKAISGRPTTGRQALAAYSATASAGAGQITISNTGASPSTWADAYGRYIIYVVRGASVPASISYQDTAYGDVPLSAVLQPTAQPVVSGDLAIMSYVYYSFAGNPTLSDASSPSLTWSTDVARSGAGAMSFPGTSDNALSAYHTVAEGSGSVSYRVAMPTTGTASYQGAGMVVFTIK